MRVLVGYASAHGSTEAIATAIGERLRAAGLSVEVRAIDETVDVSGFDAVVSGSAIHGGAWLPPAAAFVEGRGDELSRRPWWLFSVSSVGDTSSVFGRRVTDRMRRMRAEPDQVTRWRARWPVRGHRNFAGVVERSHWGRIGTLFVTLLRGTFGDHRDWDDIDRWAESIAGDLTARG